MDVTTRTFQEAVIESSRIKPVLVDFWAPWCAPCRMIGPILEKIASEQTDEWTLAKLNTDENPEVSAQFEIRGIPAVKLFVQGEVAAEFTGALPEHAVRKWLAEHLPNEARQRLAEARSLLEQGDTADAVLLLEALHASDPAQADVNLLLAEQLLFSDPERAKSLSSGAALGASALNARANALHELLHFVSLDPDALPDQPAKTHMLTALVALREQRFTEVIAALVEILKTDRYYADDAARKLGVALFTWMGNTSETRALRRPFDMWLY